MAVLTKIQHFYRTLWQSKPVELGRHAVRQTWFHHVFPILVFVLFALAFFGYNQWQYSKDPEGKTAKYSFTRTFLQGRYDQGIYRGIGVTRYELGKRSGWYPGAAIAGGILWRAIGEPSERHPLPLFYLCFFVPSIVCGVLFFYCFYRYSLIRWGPKTAVVSLASLACFPPSFYFLTAFPYNMALACMTGYLLAYEKGGRFRHIPLSTLAFFCAIAYPSTVLFAVFPIFDEARKQWGARKFRIGAYFAYGVPFVLGPLAFFTYLYFVTGDFWGYLNHQGAHYGRVFGAPIQAILDYWQNYPASYPENLTAVLVLLYLALYSNSRMGVALWAYMLAIFIFSPFTGSFQCVYRHYLLAFPLHYLCGLSSKPLWLKGTVMAIYGYICVKYFFWLYLDFILT